MYSRPFRLTLGVCTALGMLTAGTAHATGPVVSSPNVQQEIVQLQQVVAQLQTQVNATQASNSASLSRITTLENRDAVLAAQNTTLQNRIDALGAQFTVLQRTPGPQGQIGPQGPQGIPGVTGAAGTSPFVLSPDGTTYVLSGYNLQINNGMGSTESMNGLGNLIIGYNEADDFQGDFRTGSHNLILGQYNNFSSFGGLVGGSQNSITGAFASVLSGINNTASGDHSTVTGGASNTASGPFSSVSGGSSNNAFGFFSSISGGGELSAGDGEWEANNDGFFP
jgi:hypothetical protein